MIRVLLLLALCSCDTVNEATGGLGLDLGFGSVWQCEVEDALAGFGVEDVEVCWKGSQDALEQSLWVAYGNEDGAGFATCRPTERHSGPCFWCCGTDCRSWGSNSLHGSWCPPKGWP